MTASFDEHCDALILYLHRSGPGAADSFLANEGFDYGDTRRLVQHLEELGLIIPTYVLAETRCSLTGSGVRRAEQLIRERPRRHAMTLRRRMLQWLDDQEEHNVVTATWDDFLTSDHARFEGTTFTEAQLRREAEYLFSRGLITAEFINEDVDGMVCPGLAPAGRDLLYEGDNSAIGTTITNTFVGPVINGAASGSQFSWGNTAANQAEPEQRADHGLDSEQPPMQIQPAQARNYRHWKQAGQYRAAELDIHRVIVVAADDDEESQTLPGYVRRPHDQALLEALKAQLSTSTPRTMIVLTGGSSTGKTRTLYESVTQHTELQTWELVRPDSAEELHELIHESLLPTPAILWLDEAQRYLSGPRSDSAVGALRSLLDGTRKSQCIVLCTMWQEYWDDLTDPPGSSPAGTIAARQMLLHQTTKISLPENFTQQECGQILDDHNADQRLKHAVKTSGERRLVIQTLSGGRLLLERFNQPARRSDRYANSIISAAMDARRLGFAGPLPVEFLREAAPAYLTDEDRVDANEDWFNTGLDHAAKKSYHGVTFLTGSRLVDDEPGRADHYNLHDYLSHHARIHRRFAPTTERLWNALAGHVRESSDAARLAEAATQRMLYHWAIPLYDRASTAGDGSSHLPLAELLAARGQPVKAEQILAPQAAQDLRAATAMARLLATRGCLAEAEAILRNHDPDHNVAAAKALAILLADHEHVGDAGAVLRAHLGDHNVVCMLARLQAAHGQTDTAITTLWPSAEKPNQNAIRDLVDLLKSQHRNGDAVELLEQLAQVGHAACTRQLAELLVEQNQRARAIDLLRNLAGSRHTSTTQHDSVTLVLTKLLVEDGKIDEALRFANEFLPANRHTLAEFLAEQGFVTDAVALTQRDPLKNIFTRSTGIDDESKERTNVRRSIARASILEIGLKTEDAIQVLAPLVDQSASAALKYAKLLEKQKRTGDAIAALELHARKGSLSATLELAGLLERTKAPDRAIELLRPYACSDNFLAKCKLSIILVRSGQVDEAIKIMLPHLDSSSNQKTSDFLRELPDSRLRNLISAGAFRAKATLLERARKGEGKRYNSLLRYGLQPDGRQREVP